MEKFLFVLLVALTASGAHSAQFILTNRCSKTVWPGILASAGSHQVNPSGATLEPGQSMTVYTSTPWTGRFWGRTKCYWNEQGRFVCASGNCGTNVIPCNGNGGTPPVSLAEFTLGGFGGKDFYDVSLVDGFNLPMSITPRNKGGCQTTTCNANINNICPNELKVWNEADVVGCKSACFAFNTAAYCCYGAHNRPETCPPSGYSKIFKNACPQAYSYAYDDQTSTFTCAQGADYTITFCPAGNFMSLLEQTVSVTK